MDQLHKKAMPMNNSADYSQRIQAGNKGCEVIVPWTKVKGLVTECY